MDRLDAPPLPRSPGPDASEGSRSRPSRSRTRAEVDSEAHRRLRTIPQLQQLLETTEATSLAEEYSRTALAEGLRRALNALRARMQVGTAEEFSATELFA